MKKKFIKSIIITIIIIFLSACNIFAKSKNEIEINFIPFLVECISAIYTSTAIHEFGHYNTAELYNLDPNINLGIFKSSKNGKLSYYLGETVYNENTLTSQAQIKLALTGMESNRKTYEFINKNIQNGILIDRYYSAFALVSKTEFFRYALINYFKSDFNEFDDLNCYFNYSNIDKNYVYLTAILDIIFDWDDIKFHAERSLGRNPEIPKKKIIAGIEAEPKVFLNKDFGFAIGFNIKW